MSNHLGKNTDWLKVLQQKKNAIASPQADKGTIQLTHEMRVRINEVLTQAQLFEPKNQELEIAKLRIALKEQSTLISEMQLERQIETFKLRQLKNNQFFLDLVCWLLVLVVGFELWFLP
jgi:hypothetical protein